MMSDKRIGFGMKICPEDLLGKGQLWFLQMSFLNVRNFKVMFKCGEGESLDAGEREREMLHIWFGEYPAVQCLESTIVNVGHVLFCTCGWNHVVQCQHTEAKKTPNSVTFST